MRGSTPVHTSVQYSFLSSERIRSQQHSGLINLGMVIILSSNSRLIIENVLKYGLRLNLVRWVQAAAGVQIAASRAGHRGGQDGVGQRRQ